MHAAASELSDQVISLIDRNRKHVGRGAIWQTVERRRYELAEVIEQIAVVVTTSSRRGRIA
jgi:hypothetical protein